MKKNTQPIPPLFQKIAEIIEQARQAVAHAANLAMVHTYERLALSRNKEAVKNLSTKGQTIEKPVNILKNPLTLDFLGLDDKYAYSESDLEYAILSKIQQFLLELGKGFAFIGRQVRFTFEEEHFKVDLVFYNRLLRCFVVIDLKLGKSPPSALKSGETVGCCAPAAEEKKRNRYDFAKLSMAKIQTPFHPNSRTFAHEL